MGDEFSNPTAEELQRFEQLFGMDDEQLAEPGNERSRALRQLAAADLQLALQGVSEQGRDNFLRLARLVAGWEGNGS